jgi:DNA-binding MarR family transcriptional regulator
MYSSRGRQLSRHNVRRAADGLRRIVQILRLSTQAIEKQHGVSGAQLFVLQQLAENGGGSLRELAVRTHTDASSVSVVVSRLVRKGLVQTKRAVDDRRRAEVTLSPRGRQLLRKAPEPAQARLIRALEMLTHREITVFGAALGQLASSLGASPGAPAMFFEKSPRERSPRRA